MTNQSPSAIASDAGSGWFRDRLKATAGLMAVIVWAVGFCYVCGVRGFFALDQSIVFDGAWRVLQNQTPYRDFLLPFGPAVLWLQAAAFSVFGVSYKTYVSTAAVLNGVGAGMAYWTVRELSPERRWLALVAGFLTGTWLYAPMGTTYPEQTAFVCLLAALAMAIVGLKSSPIRRWGWMAASGVALGTALLCKTNAGMFGILAMLAVVAVLVPRRARNVFGDWLMVGAGMGIVLSAFCVWLWTQSDPAMFRYAALQVAGEVGSKRLFGKGFQHLLSVLATGHGNDLLRIVTVTVVTLLTAGLVVANTGCKHEMVRARRLKMFAILGLILVGFQHAFSLSSRNGGINEVPFVGLILACGVEVMLTVAQGGNSPGGWRGMSKPWIVCMLVAALGITVGVWPERNMNLLAGVVAGLSVVWIGRGRETTDTVRKKIWQTLSWEMSVSGILLATLFGLGLRVGYERRAQDVFDVWTTYVEHETIRPLQGLRWAEGAKSGRGHAEWSDFCGVLQELQNSNSQFFVLGDHTILYGLVGKPSIGPLLWFHKGLTYPMGYDMNLDQKLAKAVDGPDVTQIVREEVVFLKHDPLTDFPLFQAALSNHYHLARRFGVFTVYHRNE